MEAALGFLGWTPATFWASTPTEFGCALAGKLRSLGVPAGSGVNRVVGDNGVTLPAGMSRKDVRELVAWHESLQAQAA